MSTPELEQDGMSRGEFLWMAGLSTAAVAMMPLIGGGMAGAFAAVTARGKGLTVRPGPGNGGRPGGPGGRPGNGGGRPGPGHG